MKVALLMADGMRSDAVTHIPEVQEMMKKSKYTLEATSVMPSITLPCHLSLFLSVDPERHGTTTNVYAPQVRPVDGLCEVLHKAGKTCAFFYNWGEFRDLTKPNSLDYVKFVSCGDVMQDFDRMEKSTKMVADDAIKYLNEEKPDFAWFYTAWPDHVGHWHCWMSDEYIKAVENSWKEITRIMEAIPDDYTVIVATDHGGHDGYHGTDMPEDMIIPLFMKGPAFEPGTKFEEEVNLKDIAPTIAELLGVPANPEWRGKSVLKK